MSEKNCGNCAEYDKEFICGASLNCLVHNYFFFWKPIPPPPADEMQEVHNADRVHPAEPMVSVEIIGKENIKEVYASTVSAVITKYLVKINPNNSPELLAWALKYVEEHTSKPNYKMNIKTPTGESVYNPKTLTTFTGVLTETSESELIEWADKRALERVEIDRDSLFGCLLHKSLSISDMADMICLQNPIKLKSPTGEKGTND